MSVAEPEELDRIYSLWKDALWKALGVTADEALTRRDLYRYRITSIKRLNSESMELHVQFAPNAVYGIKHLPGREVSIVIPLYPNGEVNAPPGMAHLLTAFIVNGGIQPSNFIGKDEEGNPRVYWDSADG